MVVGYAAVAVYPATVVSAVVCRLVLRLFCLKYRLRVVCVLHFFYLKVKKGCIPQVLLGVIDAVFVFHLFPVAFSPISSREKVEAVFHARQPKWKWCFQAKFTFIMDEVVNLFFERFSRPPAPSGTMPLPCHDAMHCEVEANMFFGYFSRPQGPSGTAKWTAYVWGGGGKELGSAAHGNLFPFVTYQWYFLFSYAKKTRRPHQ